MHTGALVKLQKFVCITKKRTRAVDLNRNEGDHALFSRRYLLKRKYLAHHLSDFSSY